jgi:hypothetical protein
LGDFVVLLFSTIKSDKNKENKFATVLALASSLSHKCWGFASGLSKNAAPKPFGGSFLRWPRGRISPEAPKTQIHKSG